MTDHITWLTAMTYRGTHAIALEASSPRTIERFEDRAETSGAKLWRIVRPSDRHWVGSRLSDAELRAIRRGITRNGL